jgi:hypothetical protein
MLLLYVCAVTVFRHEKEINNNSSDRSNGGHSVVCHFADS